MNNKINYEIDNCTTDLDTLIALDKRAIRDLENNTHEIEQYEVLTIIREFIRLRNDYKQEKEKNEELNQIKCAIKLLQNTGLDDEHYIVIANKNLKNPSFKNLLDDYISKDKIRDMQIYREFELQQEYKDFENDTEWKIYNKILEEE